MVEGTGERYEWFKKDTMTEDMGWKNDKGT